MHANQERMTQQTSTPCTTALLSAGTTTPTTLSGTMGRSLTSSPPGCDRVCWGRFGLTVLRVSQGSYRAARIPPEPVGIPGPCTAAGIGIGGDMWCLALLALMTFEMQQGRQQPDEQPWWHGQGPSMRKHINPCMGAAACTCACRLATPALS